MMKIINLQKQFCCFILLLVSLFLIIFVISKIENLFYVGKMENIENQSESQLKYTITDAINDFRTAIIALIPIFEKAEIAWIDDEQNDDFAGIVEALFKWMVNFKLENLIEQKHGEIPHLPNYCYNYFDYSKMSFIEVLSNKTNRKNLAFVFLGSKEYAFDTVICNELDYDGKVIEKNVEINIEDATFRLVHHLPKGELIYYTDIK